MDDIRGYFLGPPHGTTPDAIKAKKKIDLRAVNILMRYSGFINESYRGFCYLSLFSAPP